MFYYFLVNREPPTTIINLYRNYLLEQPNMKYIDLMMTQSIATGFSLGTIKSTIRDYKQSVCIQTNSLFTQQKKVRSTIIEKVEDFDKNTIRQKIHGFQLRRDIPRVWKVLIAINEDLNLPNLCRSGLYRLSANLNFEFTKK